jgi:diguanylate cyclase (GGDEF)-like protein/PAS domain S-box-containing protein
MNPYSPMIFSVKRTSIIIAGLLVIPLLGVGIVSGAASAADVHGAVSTAPVNSASALLIALALTFAIATAMIVLRFDLGFRRLKLAEHRYRSIITQLEESILIADASSFSIIEVNPALHRLLGYSAHDLEYLRVGDIFLGAIPEIIGDVGSARQELRMRARDGRLIEAEVSISKLSMDEGSVLCLVARDITARKEIERQFFENQSKLSHLAHHDALTAMPNRLYLQANFPELIDQAQKTGKRVGLIYIDVDNFKNINDSYGHGRGDQLLLAIAERLRDAVRADDLVVRMGGDEFVVVTVVPTVEHVEHLAQRVLESLRQQFRIEGGTFELTTSSGVSVYPDHGVDLEMLLKHADIALYQAKDNGRNKLLFYSSEMNLRLSERLTLEQALRKALSNNDELYLEYQPLVDLNTGVLVGFEALVRWRHPQMIPPSRFVPVAEECGLISELGEHVLRTACKQIEIWQTAGLTMVPISINVSPKQFQGNRLVNLVESLTAEHKIRPSMLSFEITETALMETTDSYLKSLQTLRELGSRISIDDFGTGYSSLSYLKHLPIDALKIDRAFVRDMATDPNDAAIVNAIISMSRSLGLYTVAEGIETADQLNRLRDLGCQNGQGYYFSRPVPVEQCHALLEQLASHRRFVETGKIRALRPALRREV